MSNSDNTALEDVEIPTAREFRENGFKVHWDGALLSYAFDERE